MTTIVALGDSTTAGTPAFRSPIEAPPDGAGNVESQYAYWLMQTHPDWRVLNRGVNGERSDQIRARFARDVVAATPAAVVIHRRRQRHLPGAARGGGRARARSDVRRGARSRHSRRRRHDHPVQHGDAGSERADARGERRGSATYAATHRTSCSATRARRSRRRTTPTASCPRPTACTRHRTATD